MSHAELNVKSDSLSIKQTFNAPIARLFECFTKPEMLGLWHAPDPSMNISAEIDLKIGGGYRIEMTGADGKSHTAIGHYQEIDAPFKLVYSWRWESGEGPDTLVTVLFADHGAQTQVELIHSGFDDADKTRHHSMGWNGIFSRLAAYLE